MKLDLSPESWGRVIVSTIVGSVVCVIAAFYVDSFNFANMDDAGRLRAILTDALLPVVLAVPIIGFFATKLRELAIANNRLAVYASTDGLTQVMNRAAFSTLVEAYLTEVRTHDLRRRGALLIIDADNFKAVNDRYGHDRGDEALVTIALSIKSMLRAPDIVGRLGGEEFGVFLPGATVEQASRVAERIRESVRDASFNPAGAAHPLSVSVGGAVFENRLPFADLFRLADQQLYAAKHSGRDRVAIVPITGDDALAAA
ncbi:GGDEF domain-containing protein [Luteibacter sp.]|jgi:diguanylate cyclase (GGDEF)-like protein|uniref:GGDEF domain-containing protein n=1 Tax=Luteibacter sp. TaxID=1886636 RepID=UPI002F41E64B